MEDPVDHTLNREDAQHADNQENRDPSTENQEEGSLRKMFVEGTNAIATHRTENLFQQLEASTLTEEQQKIIEQRVALQRKMFEQYEKREKQRKVAELQDVVPGLTVEEAERALDLCNGREDDAAAQLVSDPAFLKRVKAGSASNAAPAPSAAKKEGGASRATKASKPAGPRPKLIDPSTLGDSVFVGAFRGKGYKPPPRAGARGGKKAATATTSSADPSDHEGHEGEPEQEADAGHAGPDESAAQREAAMEAEEVQLPSAGPARKPRSRRGADGARGGKAATEGAVAEGCEGGSPAGKGEQEGQGMETDAEAAAAAAAEADGGEAAAAEGNTAGQQPRPAETPLTVPRKYALAVETSDGGFRPATDSEVAALDITVAAASAQPTPSSVAEAAPAAVQLATLAKSVALIAKMPQEKAAQWLRRMAPEVRQAMLEQLQATQPELATAVRALLEDEPMSAPESEAAAHSESPSAKPAAAAAADDEAVPMEAEQQGQQGPGEEEAAGREAPPGAATATAGAAEAAPASEGPTKQGSRKRTAMASRRRATPALELRSGPWGEEEEEGDTASEAFPGSDPDEEFSEGDAAKEGRSSSEEEEEEIVRVRARQRASRPAPRAASNRAPRAAKAAAAAMLAQAAEVAGEDSEWEDAGMAEASSEDDASSDLELSDFEEEEEAGGRSAKRPAGAKRAGSRSGGKASAKPSSAAPTPMPAAQKPPSPAPAGEAAVPAGEGDGEVAEAAVAPATGSKRKAGGGKKGGATPAAGKGLQRKPPAKRQKVAAGAAAAAEGSGPSDQSAATGPMQAGSTAEGSDSAAGQGEGAEASGAAAEAQAPAAAPAERAGRGGGHRAISHTGHTCRGRVKQKSHKSAELVEVGTLRADNGWHNTGYIFPEGFVSRTLFRSSVALDQLCVHECFIIGKGGQYWPQPTFKVVALDRPDEPLIAKSCTGCWTGILKRINAEIEARRKAGEDLPPPPKTAIAGPEYFGLNQANIQEAIEALDPEHKCEQYWAGKQQREQKAAGLPVTAAAPRAPRPPRTHAHSSAPSASKRAGGRGRKRRGGSDSEDDPSGDGGEEDDETAYMTNRWSAVSRTERYKKRLEAEGEDTSAIDEDNPLPDFIDPITLEPVVRPAISPYGHVMGMATWKAVLAEHSTCPFTKQPLQWEQCKVLTKTNFHMYQDKIIR